MPPNDYSHIDTKLVFLLILFVSFIFFSQKGNTCEYVNIGLWSYHIDNEDDYYNEVNRRIGCETREYNFGYFKNSYNKDSLYLAKDYHLMSVDNVEFGFEYGFVTGYEEVFPHIEGISVYALPKFSYNLHNKIWIDVYSLWGSGFAWGFKLEL